MWRFSGRISNGTFPFNDSGFWNSKRINRRQRRIRRSMNSGELSSRIRRHQIKSKSKNQSDMIRMTERDENLLYSDWSPSIYETHSRMGTKYWANGRHLIGLIESDKFENRFNKTFNRGTDRSGWFTFLCWSFVWADMTHDLRVILTSCYVMIDSTITSTLRNHYVINT